jgi:hypothetical protein
MITEKTSVDQSTDNFYSLLEHAGFDIRGTRANCPYCEGSSRLTVRIGPGDVFYCHRCHRSGNTRTLLRRFGLPVAPESQQIRERRGLENRFDEWRDKRQQILAKRFHSLSLRAQWAKAALAFYPEWELAWDTLGAFYHREAELSAALDTLSCEKLSLWLDAPTTKSQLLAAFQEVCRVS